MKTLLLAGLLCLTGIAMAQEAEAVKAETVIPDAGPMGTDSQIQSNTARIAQQERMSGNQTFILQLVGILLPAVVLVLQMRQNAKINAVAKSVNGMKDELVSEVRKAATLQGAKTERESYSKPAKRKQKT